MLSCTHVPSADYPNAFHFNLLRKEPPIGEELRLFWVDFPYQVRYHIAMKSPDSRLEIRIDKDLHDFVKRYASSRHKSVTQVVRDYFVQLRRKHGKDPQIQDLSDQRTDKNA